MGAKCEEKEAEKRLKDVQKRAPKYIIMSGLAGSGKSTFSKALEATGGWVRANQDDLGRKGCEALVKKTAPMVKQGQTRLVVDRCNLGKSERAEWLDLLNATSAKEVVLVFYDFSAEDCKSRAAARFDHPTIRPGGGGRIIDEQAKQLERPSAVEGFGSIEVITNFDQANALLRRFGADSAISTAESGTGCGRDGGYTGVDTVGAPVAVAAASAIEEMLPDMDAFDGVLPAVFASWLRDSLLEELSQGDADCLFAVVEVILA